MNIKLECKAIVYNDMMDTILFYFQNYPDKREEFSAELIKALTDLLNTVKEDINNAEIEWYNSNREVR